MALTIGSAIEWWGRSQGDAPAFRFEDDTVDYRTLTNWTSRGARLLHDLGVDSGDRVGIVGANSMTWPVGALAALEAGAVLVPLNSRFTETELSKIADEAGLRAVLAAPSHEALVRRALPDPSVKTVSFDTLNSLRVGGDDDFRIDTTPESLIFVIFTSGSTGQPKGVKFTNRQVMDICFESSLREPAVHQGYSMLLALPLSFLPGMLNGVVMPIVFGGSTVIEHKFDPARALDRIERFSIEMACGVPLVYQEMAAAPTFRSADLSSLRSAIVGGAAVPIDLLHTWGDKGVALRQIYGMTEGGGVTTATTPADAFAHPDTCGFGSVFSEFRVVRDDDTDCAPGEPGEILIGGPAVTPGYWGDEVTTARAIRSGWLHTGDLGVVDGDGRLRFVDRLKDLIISGGINISPIEIESVIVNFDGVAEVSVIPVDDGRFGETPAAIVTGDVDVEELVRHCEMHLADFKVPRYVVLLDEPLPRLPTGKIAKARIRADFKDIPARFERVR
ncbi:class I adenylate-forming enzyme family protein [Rhodococcus opacus]|uniref:Putative acid--CoA ligase n=1 Tax=Rhodococcus opacus (strain B4) TaxID=632772 RepID=C1BAR5_RHOOB|nr:AMP-binding protein [Rhodococcus opacus]BAH52768.1 putative acid--CoA ligase [Rhodococcus opacus B4]